MVNLPVVLRRRVRIWTQKRPRTEVRSPDFRVFGESRLFRLADRNLQGTDAVDPAFDSVAGRERRDAGRRPRHDDVAGAERDLLRQLRDDFRYAPDQFGEVALLPVGAVDREPDLYLGRMPDFRGRLQRATRRGMVE